jgi:nucleoid DNA-binding protein
VARSKLKWSGRTIGRDELYEAARLAAGLSGSQSKLLVGQVLEEIAATLERGETVKLSSFGSFTVQQKKERIGRTKNWRPSAHLGSPYSTVPALAGVEKRTKLLTAAIGIFSRTTAPTPALLECRLLGILV